MFSLKVNRKAQIKATYSELLKKITGLDYPSALVDLDVLEDLIMEHLISRGNGTNINEIRKIFEITRMYLRERKKYLALKKISEIHKLLNPSMQNLDVYEKLRLVYDELREDWSDFWKAPSSDIVASISDDLELLGEIEKNMRNEPDDVYKQFRAILTHRGACQTSMPLMYSMAEGLTLKDTQREKIFENFNNLFKEIEKLMAPYKFEYKEEEKKGEGAKLVLT